MLRTFNFIARALVLACAWLSPALAQDYPTRAVQLVIPYTAGGATDVLGRILAEHLSTRLGQRVVPENRPGAAAVLATGQVARANPDGYTLLFGTLAHSLNATMNPNLPYDPVNDFEFVGKIGQLSFFVITNPQLKVGNLGELVSLMRSQPGKLQFASAGVGTPMHLGGELLKQITKTEAIHVPYRGESAALTDLIGGHVSFMLCSVTTCAPRLQDGTIKALSVTSPKRAPQAPALPTGSEAGVPGMETYSWFFVAAPKGTPAAIVNRLDRELNAILKDEKFTTRVHAMGIDTDSSSTPAGTRALVQSEIDKWRPVILSTGAVTK
jgi:tripartite-type tricarboxylate transporter receptor subunit TctC